MVDDEITRILTVCLRSRGYRQAQASQTARLLRYLLDLRHDQDGFVKNSLRQSASQLGASVYQMRAAYSLLLHLGWLEKRVASQTAMSAFRVTKSILGAMAEISPNVSEQVAGILAVHDSFQLLPTPELAPPNAIQYLVEITDAYLREQLHTINRHRRERYLPAYNKRSLKNIGRVMYWFIEAARRGSGKPVVTSLRQLAQGTGLVYATAKSARDYLLAWQVLTQNGDVYQLSVPRLAAILAEEVALPRPNKLDNAVSNNPE